MEKYLEQSEFLQLESNQKDIKIEKIEHMLMDKDFKELAQKQEILKQKAALLEVDKLKLQIALDKKTEKIKKALEKSKKYNEVLKEKYDLKQGWGFNPDTLEIIQREE